MIKEVTPYRSIASTADLTSNLGINIWRAPSISMAMADDKPPM